MPRASESLLYIFSYLKISLIKRKIYNYILKINFKKNAIILVTSKKLDWSRCSCIAYRYFDIKVGMVTILYFNTLLASSI